MLALSTDLSALLVAALSVGVLHTLLGPDHYLPFVAMAKARRWPHAKTAWITFLCGVGHVLGSVLLGMVGIALGAVVTDVESIESLRGDLAGWLLTAFGLVYLVWGIRRAIRNRPHVHAHAHDDAGDHTHEHNHHGDHTHVHEAPAGGDEKPANITPWILFTIFVFGPCEVLIPMLMYPAAKFGWAETALVAGAFGIATIATMMTVVMLAVRGLSFVRIRPLQRYSHALAGALVLACGLAIQFGL